MTSNLRNSQKSFKNLRKTLRLVCRSNKKYENNFQHSDIDEILRQNHFRQVFQENNINNFYPKSADASERV